MFCVLFATVIIFSIHSSLNKYIRSGKLLITARNPRWHREQASASEVRASLALDPCKCSVKGTRKVSVLSYLCQLLPHLTWCVLFVLTEHPLWLVMEYVANGSLKSYVQKHATTDTTIMLQFCLEIAEVCFLVCANMGAIIMARLKPHGFKDNIRVG